MLSAIAGASPAILSLGIRQHGHILTGSEEAVEKTFSKSGWRCHCCGVQIPGFMEIDHVGPHAPGATRMETICQFCHDLRHPLWAAARGRLVPIYAPGIPQHEITMLAWMVVAWREEEMCHVAGVYRAIEERNAHLDTLIGTRSAESFLEGVMSFYGKIGSKRAGPVLMRLDNQIRFWPSEATREYSDLPAAARLSTWSTGGFRRAGRSAAKALRDNMKADLPALERAAQAVFEEMANDPVR